MGYALLREKPLPGPNFLDRPKTAIERAANRWGVKEKSVLPLRIASDETLPGQYFDEESNLFYNWFRYYDPQLGRYITNDPIGLAGGYSTYSYAYQNPIALYDVDGLSPSGASNLRPLSPYGAVESSVSGVQGQGNAAFIKRKGAIVLMSTIFCKKALSVV